MMKSENEIIYFQKKFERSGSEMEDHREMKRKAETSTYNESHVRTCAILHSQETGSTHGKSSDYSTMGRNQY